MASKKNDWGLQAYMTVDGVLCLSNSPVQFMTTNHSVEFFSNFHYIDARQRNGIPKDSATLMYLPSIAAHSSHLPVGLAVPALFMTTICIWEDQMETLNKKHTSRQIEEVTAIGGLCSRFN